jgi:hypothetical protein
VPATPQAGRPPLGTASAASIGPYSE